MFLGFFRGYGSAESEPTQAHLELESLEGDSSVAEVPVAEAVSEVSTTVEEVPESPVEIKQVPELEVEPTAPANPAKPFVTEALMRDLQQILE